MRTTPVPLKFVIEMASQYETRTNAATVTVTPMTKLKRIGLKWYRGVRRHGLIMGCSVTGFKTQTGDSPLQLGQKAEDVSKPVNHATFLFRFFIGTICAVYYHLVPIFMWIKDQIVPTGMPI
ncbi:2-methyl-6-phytyl-1,4-hydroquinone methyltransferase 2, chloroplastic [Hordeum vulgare]|nr:2-methyl-6-phytyl-1,4-hydroquinone methyltransferase 2, chloroplastic [Hordeum vulgare]